MLCLGALLAPCLGVLLMSSEVSAETTTVTAPLHEGKVMEDRKDIDGVILHSLKIGDMRIIDARQSIAIKAAVSTLSASILRFDDRCNNDYAERREFSDKKKVCPIFNQNLIESVRLPLKAGLAYERLAGEKERFLLWRKIYNREEFNYYDLVTVREINGEFIIYYQMLKDEEARALLDNPRPRKTAFNHIEGSYSLRADEEGGTLLTMTYKTQTDHWLLNSGPALSVIYKNVAKGLRNTVEQIEKSLGTAIAAPAK